MKYINENWATTLDAMGIKSFDDWWQIEGKSAEKPNTVAGKPDTWSYVTMIQAPDGRKLFLKRQQNYHPKNLLQRWLKQLTYEREYLSYQKIRAANVPTYDLVYFASRKQEGKYQAIYVAEGLDRYVSLAELVSVWKKNGWPDRQVRRHFLQHMLETIRHMHQQGILHNALNPRHIFVNMSLDSPHNIPEKLDFKLIDFEGVKTMRPECDKAITRDFFSLHRRCADWPNHDRIWLLKQYLGIDRLDTRAKTFIRGIVNRVNKLK